MKRPRGPARAKQVESLRDEVPWVRHAWELGRRRRRVEADLRVILASSVHTRVEPLRGDDPRVAHLMLDRQLLAKLRELGRFDEKGYILGGETRIAHRPFVTETIDAIRSATHAIDEAFMHAAFSTPLERIAFQHRPKQASHDEGDADDEAWERAWFEITYGHCTKAIACEAIGLTEKAYNARRGRRRAKAGGLTIREEEILDRLKKEIASEDSSIGNHEQYRALAMRIAEDRGFRLPKELRMPSYIKGLRNKLPADCRFLDDDRRRWVAKLSKQPTRTQATWRTLIKRREQRIAGVVANMAIYAWLEKFTKNEASAEYPG